MGSDAHDELATSTTAYERRNLGPPGPGRVFGEFWWRSLALATAGGCGIGSVVGPVFIFAETDVDGMLLVAIPAALIGAVAGAAVGVMLGILAGVVMGAVGAIWLVPYRGKTTTTWTLRAVAMAAVALWFPLLAQENVYGDLTSLDLWAIHVPALAGAWYMGPWVGGWYVDRMRGST